MCIRDRTQSTWGIVKLILEPRYLMNLSDIVYYLGVFLLLKITLKFVFLIRKLFPKRFDLVERYGKNSWVLVTGASDGIGKAFCIELARLGFNVCLQGRNKEKLEGASQEVKKVNSKIATKVIVGDLVQSHDLKLFEHFKKETENLDISIVIHNAGLGLYGFIEECTDEEVLNTLEVNTIHYVMLTKQMTERMQKRKNRSALVYLSSIVSDFQITGAGVYGVTKRFGEYWADYVTAEYQSTNIDTLCLKPGPVATKINTDFEGLMVGSVDTHNYAKSALAQLGNVNKAYGYWSHELMGEFTQLIPSKLASKVLKRFAVNFFSKKNK
eukprot:TRINITY_DN735_c0_g1_i3.p1 TRINITY_DN735_c0_g1~~TRINITY_DN735_c0_g1_i3.p1  ORF type:complete len:326 (-),score=52.30 TRINITY_DN735_c0_g1_i3:111-1088(-)